MSGYGFHAGANAPVMGHDSSWRYTVGRTPHVNIVVQKKDNTEKWTKDLILYGAIAAVALYVIYGKK